MQKNYGRTYIPRPEKPLRSVLGGSLCILKVRIFDSFGEDAFEVTIAPAPKPGPSRAPSFTAKQGQYLAYIHYYTKISGRAPAESEMQSYFRVSPPSVHDMIKTLERNGPIERTPGQGRSIRLLARPEHPPALE
jgi:LexA DNA binding domain